MDYTKSPSDTAVMEGLAAFSHHAITLSRLLEDATDNQLDAFSNIYPDCITVSFEEFCLAVAGWARDWKDAMEGCQHCHQVLTRSHGTGDLVCRNTLCFYYADPAVFP
jgi:hypothetical protein